MRVENSPAKVFDFFFDEALEALYSLIKKETMRYAIQQGYPNFSVTVCRGIKNSCRYFTDFRLPLISMQMELES